MTLRAALALLLAALVTACGGGSGSSTSAPDTVNLTPPAADAGVWTEYDGAFFGAKHFRMVLADSAGQPLYGADGATLPATAYDSLPGPAGQGMAQWGGAIEHHSIKACNGVLWGFIDAYEDAATHAVYAVVTTRAEWVNLDTLAATDLSACTAGGAYSPYQIPASGRYRLRQWFVIAGTNPAYFEATFEYGTTATDYCWKGDAVKTRQVIVEQEAWWDASGGWVRATSSDLPWQSGVPVVPVLTYTTRDVLARGAGAMWRYESPSTPWYACLESIT